MVFALKRFTETNPKMTQAFLAALDESNEFIKTNKAETAEIFARASKVKVSPQDVVQIIEDPDSRFSATPHGIMEFVTFMNRAGIMKTKPATWQDLFIPALRDPRRQLIGSRTLTRRDRPRRALRGGLLPLVKHVGR